MNQRVLFFTMTSILLVCLALEGADRSTFTIDQQLVVAAFELDVKSVESLLKGGASPNARLGIYDRLLFEDKWTLAYSPLGCDKWTPLLAVAGSHRAKQPKKRIEATLEGREEAMRILKGIDPKLIAERDARRKAIAKLLLDAKANLDVHDGYGTTALAKAVENNYENVALLLIESEATINTKTGIYIDGPADITPLHRATANPVILSAMIRRGAEVDVRSSDGDSPLHWAASGNNVESVKLLLEAGADPSIADKEGRTPAHWCRTFDRFAGPGDAEKKQIMKLLQAAADSKK